MGIRMPDEQHLPPGPRRELVIALHDLYALAEQGRVDEAIVVLRVRADAGDRRAAGRLATLLAEQGSKT